MVVSPEPLLEKKGVKGVRWRIMFPHPRLFRLSAIVIHRNTEHSLCRFNGRLVSPSCLKGRSSQQLSAP